MNLLLRPNSTNFLERPIKLYVICFERFSTTELILEFHLEISPSFPMNGFPHRGKDRRLRNIEIPTVLVNLMQQLRSENGTLNFYFGFLICALISTPHFGFILDASFVAFNEAIKMLRLCPQFSLYTWRLAVSVPPVRLLLFPYLTTRIFKLGL